MNVGCDLGNGKLNRIRAKVGKPCVPFLFPFEGVWWRVCIYFIRALSLLREDDGPCVHVVRVLLTRNGRMENREMVPVLIPYLRGNVLPRRLRANGWLQLVGKSICTCMLDAQLAYPSLTDEMVDTGGNKRTGGR